MICDGAKGLSATLLESQAVAVFACVEDKHLHMLGPFFGTP